MRTDAVQATFANRPRTETTQVVTSGPAMPQAVTYLQIYAWVLMVVPSDNVIAPIGGSAHLVGLLGLFGLGWWAASAALRLHDPRDYPSPIRLSFLTLWAFSLLSYFAMALVLPDETLVNGADRWMLEISAWIGVGLVAIEALNSLDDFRRLLRAISLGGAVCGAVAAVQFWFGFDLAEYLRVIPGFSRNFDWAGIMDRDSLARVAGTALHPIELGVVTSALLPLAVVSGMIERTRSTLSRWGPVLLVGVGVPASASRSAILTTVIAMALFVACLRPKPRAVALLLTPLALVTVFMTAPGLIGTMRVYFLLGSDDSSIATRQDDLPLVHQLVTEAPWLGRGGGTHIVDNVFDILDNQYLKMMVEFGLPGAFAIAAAYFVFPVFVAFAARKRSTVDDHRDLGAALGASATVATVCAATFDSLSFPQFAGLQALLIGMIGAYWRLVRAEERERDPASDLPPPLEPPSDRRAASCPDPRHLGVS